jgi:hypothetical protein
MIMTVSVCAPPFEHRSHAQGGESARDLCFLCALARATSGACRRKLELGSARADSELPL